MKDRSLIYQNSNLEYLDSSRWTPELAALWYVKNKLPENFGKKMEDNYPGGFWTTMNGKAILVKKNGEIAEETFPKLIELKNMGDASYLGGAGKKDIYSDNYGRQYIFKPSVSKSGCKELFRALVQQAVSKIASRIFRYGDHVPVHVDTATDLVFGSVQPLIPGVIGNLKDINWRLLTTDQVQDIQREHVLDWTTGNFDSHAGNFILIECGKVLGVDKEQAFRYTNDSKSLKLSLDYHPNAEYGEWEPIYNDIYRDFANGKIDLDLGVIEEALLLLESISEVEYRQILKPYAESLNLKESFYQKALERKKKARAEFHDFFTRLKQQRDINIEREGLDMTEQNNENKSPKQEKQVPLIERWANDPNPCGFSTPAPKKTTSTKKKK